MNKEKVPWMLQWSSCQQTISHGENAVHLLQIVYFQNASIQTQQYSCLPKKEELIATE